MADSIKVVVKVRPVSAREAEEGLRALWEAGPAAIWVRGSSAPADRYAFDADAVLGETTSPRALYDRLAAPVVAAALGGINGTIFAYGQTSSGKTYTMMGTDESAGIIPMAIHHVFEMIEEKKDRDFLLRASYIEIYNDKIRDLLDIQNTDLKVHEDFNGQVNVNSKEIVTTTPESVLDVMQKGNQNRSVGGTLMNDMSSRSHAIFQIIIESRKHASSDTDEDESVNVSHLNFVDLAGSERASSTGDNKGRLREGGHINKSLTTLSLVIRQLSEAQGDINRHISYRDSKLTRILQSSLGGNAKTGVICTVTPAVLDETHSTLKFAMYAKVVKNKPVVNAVMSNATQLKILTKQIKTLEKDVESKKHLEEHNLELTEKILKLQQQILMGNVDPEVKQRNTTLRRRTWCAAPQLYPILEHSDTPNTAQQRFFFNRGSNSLENNKNEACSRSSTISSNETSLQDNQCVLLDSDDLICIDDSDEEIRCSPKHKCFDIHKTPPCVLRGRTKFAEKEFKELQEMTKLEHLYVPKEIELIQQYKSISEEFRIVKDELTLIKNKYKTTEKDKLKLIKEMDSLKCINIDMEFKLETAVKNHKRREDDLILSLQEARNKPFRTEYDQPILADSLTDLTAVQSNANINISTQTESMDTIINSSECIKADLKLASEIESLNFELKQNIEINECLEILLAEKNIIEEQLKNENSELKLEIEHLNCLLAVPEITIVPPVNKCELKQNMSIEKISHEENQEINSSLTNGEIEKSFDNPAVENIIEHSNDLVINNEVHENNTENVEHKSSIENISEENRNNTVSIDENKAHPLNCIELDNDTLIMDNKSNDTMDDELNNICCVLDKLLSKYSSGVDREISSSEFNQNNYKDIAKSEYIFNKVLEIEKILAKESHLESKLFNVNTDKIKLINQLNTEFSDDGERLIENTDEKIQNDLLKSKISTPKFKTNNYHNLRQSFIEINKENIIFPNCDILDVSNVSSPLKLGVLKFKSNNSTPCKNDSSTLFTQSKNNSGKINNSLSFQKTDAQSNITSDTSLELGYKLNTGRNKRTNLTCDKCNTFNEEYINKIRTTMGSIKEEINAINNSNEIETLYRHHNLKSEFIIFCTFINKIVDSMRNFQTEFLFSNADSNSCSIDEDLKMSIIPPINFVKIYSTTSDGVDNIESFNRKSISTDSPNSILTSESETIDLVNDSNLSNKREDILLLLSEFRDTISNYELYLHQECKNMDPNDIDNNENVLVDDNEQNLYFIVNNLHARIKNIVKVQKSSLCKNNFSLSKSFANLNNVSLITEDDVFKTTNFLNKINELTIDSEEMQKQLLQQQNKQHVDNAELRGLTSELIATEHYHKCVHNTCQSTIKYLKENLNTLQLYLQNLTEENNTYNNDHNDTSTFINSYSNITNVTNETSCFENTTMNNFDKCDITNDCNENYKIMYDNLLAESKQKNEENLNLSEKLKKFDEFECKVNMLECENASLSSEIMDYIQEIESLQSQVRECNKNKNDVALNTSLNFIDVLQQQISNEKQSENASDSQHIECHFNFDNVNIISTQWMINNFIEEILTVKSDLEKILTLIQDSKDLNVENNADKKYVINLPLAVKLICSENTSFISEFMSVKDNFVDSRFIEFYKLCRELMKLNSACLCETCERKFEAMFKSPDSFIAHNLSESVVSTATANDEYIEKINALESELKIKEKIIEDLNVLTSNINLDLEKMKSDYDERLSMITSEFNNAINRENNLKSEIENLMDKIEHFNAEIKCSNDKEEELLEKLSAVKRENVELSEKVKLFENQLQDLLLTSKASIEDYSEKINKYQDRITEYEEIENNMKKQNDVDKSIITTLQSEINSLELKNKNLENKMSINDNEIKLDYDERLSMITNEFNNAINRENYLKSEIEYLMDKNERFNAEIKCSNDKNEQLLENISAVTQENVELSEKVKLFENQLQDLLLTNKATIDDYSEKINKCQSRITVYEEKENNMKKQNDADKSIIITLQSEINSLELKNKDLENKMSINDNEIKIINEKYVNIQKNLNEQEDEYKNYKVQYQTLSQEKDSLTLEVKQYKDNMAKMLLENNQLKSEIEKNIAEIDLKKQEVNSLTLELEKVQSISFKREADIQSALTLKENDTTNIINKNEIDMSILKKKHSELITNLVKLWKNIDSKKSDLNDESYETDVIIDLIRQEVANYNTALEAKSDNVNEISIKLNEAMTMNNSLKTQIDDLKNKILDVSKQNEESIKRYDIKVRNTLIDLLKIVSKNTFSVDSSSDFDCIVNKIKSEHIHNEQCMKENENKICEVSLKLENEIVVKNHLTKSLSHAETNLEIYKNENIVFNSKIGQLYDILCEDSEHSGSSSNNIDYIIEYSTRTKLENNQLNTSIKNYELQTKALKNELNELKIMCEKLNREKNCCIQEIECKDQECKKYLSNIANLEVQIEELTCAKTSEPSPVTPLGAGSSLMEYFVDKMTYDLLQEKNKQLQKSNEDMRIRNSELIVEIRRLQHTIQNSTLNNLLPNDKANITQLKDRVKQLESEVAHLKTLKSNYDEITTKYKDLDEEYEEFLKIFKEKEEDCRQLYGEKKLLESQVASLEMEISETKTNNQNLERRKKRQSLHDSNRGSLPKGDNTTTDFQENNFSFERLCNSNKIAELEKENQLYKKDMADLANVNTELRNNVESLKRTVASLSKSLENVSKSDEHKKTTIVTDTANQTPDFPNAEFSNSTFGSAIIRDQKLREYMAENVRLNNINSKLKDICRMRDKKIKELEKSANT